MFRITRCTLAASLLLVVPIGPAALAEDVGQPVSLEVLCQGDPKWNKQELFVWDKVCHGQEADFNDLALKSEYGGALDPSDAEHWPVGRTLTSKFIESILLDDKYRRVLTRRGVRITGARFIERVDLENADLRHELWLRKSRLHDGADLSGLRSTRLISFEGSVVSDQLDSENGIDGHDFNLSGATIGGDLFLDGGGRFKQINLSSATVQGELAVGSSAVMGTLNCEGLTADNISLDDGATFGDFVYLKRVITKGDITLQGTFSSDVDLTGARIDGDLNLGGSVFSKSMDLTGAQIGGELSLISYDNLRGNPAKWLDESSSLDLRNAKADKIPGLCSAWPRKLNLEGFSYRSGGAAPQEKICSGGDKKTSALDTWLKRLVSHSSQPYEQLAAVLQNQGDSENATAVRYSAREDERSHAASWRWLGLTILKYFIGYGYYLQCAFVPVIVFLIMGVFVMRVSGEDKRTKLPPFAVAYTFDMLLPIVRLRDSHYSIDLKGWAQYYFYVHKVMGYVLASVLIAAVAGLTK
jgi:hypothetical protein